MPDICRMVGRDKHHLVQLCLPIERLKGSIKFPVLASEKLDGVFAFALVYGRAVYIYSRTGEEYKSLEHLKPELWQLAQDTDMDIIIFEAYTRGVPQPTISGWCRDKKKQHVEVDAYIHDIMTFTEFKTSDTKLTYGERAEYLKTQMSFQSYKHLHLIEQRLIAAYDALMYMAESVWSMGGEGVVARPMFSGYYAGKRNNNMIKIKQGVSFDLRVVGLKEGNGKYQDMVGYLICEDRNGVRIKVGTGMSDRERKDWWSDFGFEEIMGKVVQVDAMAVSTKGVLREPRFKGIRYDKTEVDIIK